jgi:hypothetical protein
LTIIGQDYTDQRDSSNYTVVKIETLFWMTRNLNYTPKNSKTVKESQQDCGKYYSVNESMKVCPVNWRLPNELEVKRLFSLEQKGLINISDTLDILMCGKFEDEFIKDKGNQNSFWIESTLSNGSISHWQSFGTQHDINFNNVEEANKKFPLRCVTEVR